MGSQQFCLRWNNHQLNMLGVFDQLLQSETLVDVTIACEGLSLKAHKVVLSACSPFFQSLFLDNPCKHPIIILKDIKYSDLKALIDFMYRGEVNVTQEQLSALLQTAETLKVKGLAEVTGGGADTPAEITDNSPSAQSQQAVHQDDRPPSRQMINQCLPGADDSRNSPPAKRKKVRSRRRSGGGSNNQSDKEDDDIHLPLEVVETKVEVVEDDEAIPETSSQFDPIINQSFPQSKSSQAVEVDAQPITVETKSAETVIALNRSFSSSGAMEVLACTTSNHPTSAPAMNRTVSLPPPLIPSQTNVPVLPASSLPSTSGSQSSGQDITTGIHWNKDRRSFPFRGKESVRLAVDAVLKYNISFREAARRFGVNHSTVYNHVKFARMRHAKMCGKHIELQQQAAAASQL